VTAGIVANAGDEEVSTLMRYRNHLVMADPVEGAQLQGEAELAMSLPADEWDQLATAEPEYLPGVAKLFHTPSVFGE
jgi:hypothetical protein